MSERADLVTGINDVLPEFVARTVLFHQAVAQQVGLTATDLHCFNLLLINGPMSPSELAQDSGLTTGAAITGAIDRLEREGLARRRPDPDDRRRVLVHPDRRQAERRIAPLYAGIGVRHGALVATYSLRALATVRDYLVAARDLTRAATQDLRSRG